jgi:phosphomannomutase
MKIDSKIFKAYDIRGFASDEITPALAEAVGRAVVAHTGAKVVVVGRDMRETSLELAAALIKGIVASGSDVVDIGLTSTPMFYYAVGQQFGGVRGEGAGVMVTASHNPKEYNGFKMVLSDLEPIGEGSGMENIRDLVIAGNFSDAPEGNVMETDVREEYVAKHLEIVPRRDIGQPRTVFDAGNGMAGFVAPGIIKAYGLEKKCRKMFFELDGTFPNHVPDPLKPENLTAVIAMVKKEGADIGVAYDGDADRVRMIDETGAPVEGDIMTALLAGEVLRQHPGATILYDVRSSRAVPEAIASAGGKPVMCRVGHAFIKKQMHETGAWFAGELSTHYYFRDFFMAESSDLALLHALAAMKRMGKKLSELIAPIKKYFHSEEINFSVNDKNALMKRLEEKYGPLATETIRIDGLRFEFPSWWFNVRPSNTEPLVRLNLEAQTKEEMDARVEEVAEIIRRF